MASSLRSATEDDLRERSRSGARCELVDGRIVEMSPAGGRHGQVCARILARLVAHAEENDLGAVFDSSTGFRLPNGNVRAPDVAFVVRGRLAGETAPAGFIALAPDLAVEVRSPDDSPRELLDKVGEYLAAGTRLVWLADPASRTLVVYRSLQDVTSHAGADAVDGGEVLPGFRCPLSRLF